MHVRANGLLGIIEPAGLRSENATVLDNAFLLCALTAAIGWVIGIGTATAVQHSRPRRIEWDEPAEAEG